MDEFSSKTVLEISQKFASKGLCMGNQYANQKYGNNIDMEVYHDILEHNNLSR